MHFISLGTDHRLEKIQLTLEQVMKAQRASTGIAVLFFNLCARWRWVVNATPRPLYPQEKDPVLTV